MKLLLVALGGAIAFACLVVLLVAFLGVWPVVVLFVGAVVAAWHWRDALIPLAADLLDRLAGR